MAQGVKESGIFIAVVQDQFLAQELPHAQGTGPAPFSRKEKKKKQKPTN